jgi:hypothetical protein
MVFGINTGNVTERIIAQIEKKVNIRIFYALISYFLPLLSIFKTFQVLGSGQLFSNLQLLRFDSKEKARKK